MEEITKFITLENNIEYGIVDIIDINNITYYYLTNPEDIEDFCIRKVITENNEEFVIGLDDEKEYDLALTEFAKKHQ